MKKFKMVLTAIAMLLSVSSFATEPVKASPAVIAAFQKDFSKATQVNWEKSSDFYFASFTLNNLHVDAAYTAEGALVGTSRKIMSDQLPLSIALSISENYAGYQVGKPVVELTFEGVTRYYVYIENDSQLLKLKCYANGDLEVDRKIKK